VQQRTAAFLLTALMAGCGGSVVVPQQNALPALRIARITREPQATANVSIRIPQHPRHRAHYISVNSTTMKLTANGKLIGSFRLWVKTKYCILIDGARQCTFTVGVPAGKVTFGVALYDARNAVLSRAKIVKTIEAGRAAQIALVLEGVIKRISVTLQSPNPNAGVAAKIPVYLTAFDASGAAIVGPGNYSVPVKMIDTDKMGATSISPTRVSAPGTPVTLTYTGKSMFSATIGATASGATVDPAQFVPTPHVFASFSATGVGPASLLAITSGPDGNVWVTTTQGAGGIDAIVRLTATGTPAVFDHANTPALTDDSAYDAIVEDSAGNVWFTENNANQIGEIPRGTAPGGTVREYGVTGLGTFCPEKIVAGNNSDLWFTSNCSNLIGNITTAGTLTGPAFAEAAGNNQSLLLSKIDGKLYVVDRYDQAIDRYAISGHSVGSPQIATVPDNTIRGTAWPNYNLSGIAQTSDGQLWFSNDTCTPNTIGAMTPFSTASIREYTSATGSDEPNAMVVAPDGNTIFLALANHPQIERVENNGPGVAPTLDLYAVETRTPNDVFQSSVGIVIGPNGNLWIAGGGTGYTSAPNVLEMAY
jgi:streptogramin lyase